MKITKSQLKSLIKEEVSKIQKITILENRKRKVQRELRILNENYELNHMGASGTQFITIPSIAELKEKNIQDDFEEAVEMWMEGSVQGQDLKEGEEYEVYFGDYEIAFTLVKNGDKFVVNAVKVEQDLDETLKINETEILNEEESSFNVEIPDWLTSKLEQVHTKPGQGSIFAKPIKSVMDLVKSHLTKMNPKEVDKIANSALGTVSFNVSGIGYDLVLPMEKAKTLKDAQQVEVEKVEGSNKINVPAIKTSEDVKNFSTGLLTIIVRPKEDDSKNVLKGQYIVLSAFPGNPEIPKTSEWNGEFAVIIPNSQLNESIRKIVREGFLSLLKESVSKEQIKQIVLKHNKDFYKVEDELSNNNLEIDVYDGHPSERGYFNIIDSSGNVIISGQVEDEEITGLQDGYQNILNESVEIMNNGRCI